MRPVALDSAAEVEQVFRNLLRGSKALDRFPTPVDTIIDYAELAIAKNIDLSKVESGFLPRLEFLASALKSKRPTGRLLKALGDRPWVRS